MNDKLNPLEWQIKKDLESEGIRGGTCLVSVSGGLDSMCLLSILHRLKGQLDLQLEVCSIFHGWNDSRSNRDVETGLAPQDEFRLRSWELVRSTALQMQLPFSSNVENPLLSQAVAPCGEAALRELRRQFWREQLEKIAERTSKFWLVLAHQQEDVLETQLVRLIRGCGPDGFAQALPWRSGVTIRPLIRTPRLDLRNYALQLGLTWMEDPSNLDTRALRNWIRNHWLFELEHARPGAKSTLAHSLHLIAESLSLVEKNAQHQATIKADGIYLPEFYTLTMTDQRRVLAKYMNLSGIKNYTRAHIDEIIKRLASRRRRLEFRAAGRSWSVNTNWITATPERD